MNFTLNGTRLLLNKPEAKETTVTLLPEAKEALEKEVMREWHHLEIFAVGDQCNQDKYAPGKKVFIPTGPLQDTIQFVNIDGEVKILVSEHIVALVWED